VPKVDFCGERVAHAPHNMGEHNEEFCTGYPNSGRDTAVHMHVHGDVVMPGVGRDAEIEVNANGAGQSKIPYAFQLVDGVALGKMAEVLKEGADKYGANNWRQLPIADHLNHLIMHAYAWLAGDRQDDHLSHIMCRAMFAQGVEARGGVITNEQREEINKRLGL
jgi:hypothetical protein